MNALLDISPQIGSFLVVLLPVLAFLYQACIGRSAQSGVVPIIAIFLSAIISIGVVFPAIWNRTEISTEFTWFTIGQYTMGFGLQLNNLSVLMQLIVCLIALPVHIYSRQYMKGDSGIHRYWTYLSLFCAAMLGLTISSNLFMMYLFWELVGFASYLLIGFWYDRDAAVQANKKAFIVNRIGDLGFLLGIASVYSTYGSLNLVELFGDQGLVYTTQLHQGAWPTFTGICFVIGAMAKSAQFPLHVWLPDAMEGPTSVSSLIHAATMVAAGIFLLSTVFPLFNETVLIFIAIIGCLTAGIAAAFALAQNDIKRILAFSTVSQLGYMMAAIGMGAWDAAMFHLATHAFFKCLLFLGAGAIIHEMVHLKTKHHLDFDPQNINNMGGLRQWMPKTFVLMTVASLALAGFPLTSGFLSKDALLVHAFQWALSQGGITLMIPLVLSLVSLLTAFYIGRLMIKVFFGKFRISLNTQRLSLQEAAAEMLIPMIFLAAGSLFFGFSLHPLSFQDAFILQGFAHNSIVPEIHFLHWSLPIGLTIGTVITWLIVWRWYILQRYPFKKSNKWIEWSYNQGYINQLYETVITNNILRLSAFSFWADKNLVDGWVHLSARSVRLLSTTAGWIDRYVIDGLVNTIAGLVYYIGHLLRWAQNGRLQNYLGLAFTILLIGIVYLIFR